MWDELSEREYTKEEKLAYERYVKEWEYRKRAHREEFVDWSISRGNGDPFTIEEWIDKPSLHNF